MEITYAMIVMKTKRRKKMSGNHTYTKQDEFNRIKAIIENPKNNSLHVVAIGNLVRNFAKKHGDSKLSNSLMKLKTKYCNEINN